LEKMASKLNITYLDYSLETSTAGFTGVTLTAGNFAAQAALMDTLVSATQAITLATKIKDSRIAVVTPFAETRPTSPYAQRESKWLLRYSDTVSPAGNGTIEVPASDLDLLDANGTHMDLASTEGAAFKAAFEAFQRSRLGNSVTLDSIEFVGRNN
jgi:hypothetical protein